MGTAHLKTMDVVSLEWKMQVIYSVVHFFLFNFKKQNGMTCILKLTQ